MYFRSQRKSSQDVSLSDYIDTGNEGAELSLMDVVSQDDNLLETLSQTQITSRLRQVMAGCLTGQEYRVLALRFGLEGQTPKRQREVAEITGISRSYVSQHAYCKR